MVFRRVLVLLALACVHGCVDGGNPRTSGLLGSGSGSDSGPDDGDDGSATDGGGDTGQPDPSADSTGEAPDAGCTYSRSLVALWDTEGGGVAGGEVAAVLQPGEPVEVTMDEGEWRQVTAGPRIGWARSEYFDAQDCDLPYEAPPATHARNVMLLIFAPSDPATAMTSWQTYGWNDPHELAMAGAAWWEHTSRGRLAYRIVEEQTWSEFPVKADGYQYTWEGWSAVIDGAAPGHNPDLADYPAIIEGSDLCQPVNAGEVDELWMFGGPWFGFAESALVGPGGFNYNGPAYADLGCERLIPIMGFNYERGLGEFIHDFGHRTEATMTQVYGGWQQNQQDTPWNAFGLNDLQSPNFDHSGCGSVHYPPNAASEYDYADPNPALSYCDNFSSYPNLPSPLNLTKVTCEDWGCSQHGYFEWWFSHLPQAEGTTGHVANDWYSYVIEPGLASSCPSVDESAACDALPQCGWQCGTCWLDEVDPVDACSTCGHNSDLPSCDATPGCAWYACAAAGTVACWEVGTPNEVACG